MWVQKHEHSTERVVQHDCNRPLTAMRTSEAFEFPTRLPHQETYSVRRAGAKNGARPTYQRLVFPDSQGNDFASSEGVEASS